MQVYKYYHLSNITTVFQNTYIMMLRTVCLVVIFACFSVLGDITVTLPGGQIQGLERQTARNRTFYAFLQVPYAQPPLGKLRFKDPQPVKNWNGVLDATVEKRICYQVLRNSDMETEDCLNLNIYTPVHPNSSASLAVMFYIHGGGFMNGESLYNTFGPHHFMDNNVVVVTIFYRLGPFGFLSTQDDVIPGNFGLKDQALALKWVQQNIRYFGGDPAKVTIFGQSSGAVSVGYHIISKKSSGLFRGAIQQSGSVLSPHGYQRRAREFAYALAQFVNPNFSTRNSSEELLDLLLNTPATQIDAATQKFTQGPGSMILSEGSWFAPVVECEHADAFITDNMYESISNGDINKVPLIVGITSEEAISQAADLNAFRDTVAQYDNNVTLLVQGNMHIANQTIKTLVGEAIRRIYSDGLLQDNLGAAVRYFSDAYVSKSVIRHAELQSSYTNVYFYQFSYHGSLGNNNVYIQGAGRVSHSEDNKYLWVSNGDIDINKLEPNDLKTVNRYVKLFTDFSKTLNPTPQKTDLLENTTWPRVTPQTFPYLNIGQNLEINTNPKEATYRGWVSIYNRWGVQPFDTY